MTFFAKTAIAAVSPFCIASVSASAQSIVGGEAFLPQPGVVAEPDPSITIDVGSAGVLDESPCGLAPFTASIGQTRGAREAAFGPLRAPVFTPDRMVGTMDHVPQRPNLFFDGNDILQAANCG